MINKITQRSENAELAMYLTMPRTKFKHCIRLNKFIHCLNLYLATLSGTCSSGLIHSVVLIISLYVLFLVQSIYISERVEYFVAFGTSSIIYLFLFVLTFRSHPLLLYKVTAWGMHIRYLNWWYNSHVM